MNIITKLAYNALTKTIQAIAPGGISFRMPDYEDGSFSATFTGPFTTTVTIYYRRVGKMVTLDVPEIGGTSTVATYIVSVGVIPNVLRPIISTHYFPAFVKDNSADLATPGFMSIGGNGDISIRKSFTSDAFTASGSASGPRGSLSVTYAIL